MPEIWLPYGSVEIAVELRAENLAEVLEPTAQKMKYERIVEQLNNIEFSKDMLIILADQNRYTSSILQALLNIIYDRDASARPSLIVKKENLARAKKLIEGRSINIMTFDTASDRLRYELNSDPPRIEISTSSILITQTEYDPLFGYSGGAASLIRGIGEELLSHIVSKRRSEIPKPGHETEAGRLAMDIANNLPEVISIEVIGTGGDIVDIAVGSIGQMHRQMIERLDMIACKEIDDEMKAVVISPGVEKDLTLSDSLKAVWNILEAMKEKAPIILAAECSNGLGSKAMELFATDRIDVQKGSYVEGLEDILYLRSLSQRHSIILLSSLPNYLVERKFRFRSVRRMKDAVDHILSGYGGRTKFHVVPRGSETLIRSLKSRSSD